MNRKQTITSVITVFALSVTLVAAQMQMPENSAKKAGHSSSEAKTVTGIVSDSMC